MRVSLGFWFASKHLAISNASYIENYRNFALASKFRVIRADSCCSTHAFFSSLRSRYAAPPPLSLASPISPRSTSAAVYRARFKPQPFRRSTMATHVSPVSPRRAQKPPRRRDGPPGILSERAHGQHLPRFLISLSEISNSYPPIRAVWARFGGFGAMAVPLKRACVELGRKVHNKRRVQSRLPAR